MSFTELTNRDAWGTIRGFAYQLDTTLLRWIALQENQVLELERGEDIDVVTKSVTTHQSSRELEQVKYRENGISLNQDMAVEMLFNFFQHLTNNPSQELLFRYVTNASYVVERPALLITGVSGIEMWQALTQAVNVRADDTRLVAIQQQLQSKIQSRIKSLPPPTQPDEVTLIQEAWLTFAKHIAEPAKLLAFMRQVQWSTQQPDYVAVGHAVEAALLAAKLVTDVAHAKMLYARLFLHVIKRLSEPGLKQLSPAELRAQAQLPELATSDQRLLRVVESLLNNLENRVSALEAFNSQNRTQLAQLLGRVDLLNQTDSVFEYRLAHLADGAPPLVQYGTQRAQKVANLKQLLKTTPWVHLPGTNGSGKSQLAALVARQYEVMHWLELQAHNDTPEKANLLLEAFLTQVTGRPLMTDRPSWLQEVAMNLPNQALLVLNDLPRIERGSALAATLIALATQLTSTGGRLLTTSNFNVPSATGQLLPVATLSEYTDLNFTDQEIAECLANRGVDTPDAELVGLIGAVTHYNPTLVSALLYQMQELNWGPDGEQLLEALISRDFMVSPREEVQLTINRQLTDKAAKQLLYRLSLLKWEFSFAQVQAVGEVTDAVENVFEALQRILHQWVQLAGKLYYVSPLVHDLGEQNLPAQTIQQVHLAVAESILTSPKLDLLDAVRCFQALCKGKNYAKAGSLLVNLFQLAETLEHAQLLQRTGLLQYATTADIPASVPRQLRAVIRYEQIRLHQLLNLDAKVYQQWLSLYASATDGSLAERVVLRLLKLLNAAEWNLPVFVQDMLFILDNQASLSELATDNPPSIRLVELFWLPIRSIRSAADLVMWWSLADKLRAQASLVVWQEPIAQNAVTLVARQVAAGIPPSEALTILQQWAQYFTRQRLELLWATVESVRLPLRFQHEEARPSVFAEVTATTATLTNTEAQYLLYFTLGKACYDAGLEEGASWLVKAINLQCLQQESFTEALIYAAAAVSTRDQALAVRFSRQAEALAAGSNHFSEEDYVQVLAELALACWLHQDIKESFTLFEKVVDRFPNEQDGQFSANWVRLYVLLRHALGYIAPTTARERPPKFVADGGDYVPPYQGFFSFNRKDLSDLYAAHPDPHLLFYEMALFAEGIGETERAYKWSQQAFDAARRAPGSQALIMIASLCGQYSLATGHYAEALEAQLLASAVRAYIQQTGLSMDEVMATLELQELEAQRPGPVWDAAEAAVVMLTLPPMLAQVLTAQAAGQANAASLTLEAHQTIEQYRIKASDQKLWSRVVAISTEALSSSDTSQQLLRHASDAGRVNQKALQVMCYLGVIARSTDGLLKIRYMIETMPYLTNLQQVQLIIIKAILGPFVKQFSKTALVTDFIGAQEELEQLLVLIDAVDPTDSYVVQRILQPAVEAIGLIISPTQNVWLHSYQTT